MEGAEKMAAHMAETLKRRRREMRVSLDEVAQRAGCSKSHVWEIETGRARNPTVGMAIAIAEALHCSLDELLGIGDDWCGISDQERALLLAHRQIFKVSE